MLALTCFGKVYASIMGSEGKNDVYYRLRFHFAFGTKWGGNRPNLIEFMSSNNDLPIGLKFSAFFTWTNYQLVQVKNAELWLSPGPEKEHFSCDKLVQQHRRAHSL